MSGNARQDVVKRLFDSGLVIYLVKPSADSLLEENMPRRDWDENYTTGDAPWDTGEPNRYLTEFVESGRVKAGRSLEVGCGTGTNSVWLAEKGFDVLGLDISSVAVEMARARLANLDVDCRFILADFLNGPLPDGPFDFVFDLGCFHVFDGAEERFRFAKHVSEVLARNGVWLSLIGSTEGPARDHGPPRRSLRDVVNAVEPNLEIVEISSIEFGANMETPAAAWFCLSRIRKVPPQPSTVASSTS